MRLDSARDLKAALRESVLVPMATSVVVRSAGLRAQPTSELSASPPTMALGVVPKGNHDFGIAVRIQKRGLENSQQVQTIRKKAKGEVDVRYVGEVTKRSALPWYQKTTRTLTGLGKLSGLGDPLLAEDGAVGKFGRTTGTT